MKDKKAITDLVAGSVLLLFLGIIYVWAKFVAPVSEVLAWDTAKVKLTANFTLCCFVIGILVSGLLINKVKPKLLVLCGGVMLALGVFAASFTPPSAPWLIYVTYGIIAGMGVGIAYNTILSCAQKHFPQKRQLAIGISVFSFGFSTVIFAPLAVALTERLGVVNTFRVLAAVFAVATLALCNFISQPDTTAAAATAAKPKANADGAGADFTLKQSFSSPNLWLMIGLMVFGNATYLVANPSFQSMADDRLKVLGDTAQWGTVMMMLAGIVNAVGRLAWPLVGKLITARWAAVLGSAFTALCALSLAFSNGWLFIISVALVAFFFGGFSGVNPVLTSDYFGLKNVGSIYAIVMVGYMVAALSFPIIFNALSLGDVPKFVTLAVLAAVGGVLMLLLHRHAPKAKA